MRFTFTLLLFFFVTFLAAQTFTKVENTPIDDNNPTTGYAGASWVDYDGDGDIDLFVNEDFLYQNDGSGNFTQISNSGIEGTASGLNNGNSWADADNDGDLDLALVNQNTNGVYLNNGDGTFSKITTGDIATSINAWSAAWADYDNDGWVDLTATHPCGFIGSCHGNWLFKSNGDGTFTEVTSSEVNMTFAAYTIANWADFDDDGDMDLFVGSGEVSTTSKDHIYINQLTETDTAVLLLEQNGVLFGDVRDGQNWNLIDYDNDGDLDAFVTNYRQNVPNDFYVNNGDGTFTKLTETDLDANMSSLSGTWLANTWGDFNNDGWMDVVITADNNSPAGNKLFLNDGDGTFTELNTVFSNLTGSRATVNGDYDNDGDLDLFINAAQTTVRGLFKNELALNENQNWLSISLEGTTSNRSAIGAKVRIKATINGQEIWQRRDISTQNAFCGQNDMRLHFGLGNATTVDSLIIQWPMGLIETYENVSANQFLSYVEGPATSLIENKKNNIAFQFAPNPARSQVRLNFEVKDSQNVVLKLLDASLNEVKTYIDQSFQTGNHVRDLSLSDIPAGIYFLSFQNGKYQATEKLIVLE